MTMTPGGVAAGGAAATWPIRPRPHDHVGPRPPADRNGGVMHGKMVSLERPNDEDYALTARWFGPDAAAAVMAATEGDVVTAEDFRRLDHTGALRQFAVRDRQNRTVGAVHYKSHGPVGG